MVLTHSQNCTKRIKKENQSWPIKEDLKKQTRDKNQDGEKIKKVDDHAMPMENGDRAEVTTRPELLSVPFCCFWFSLHQRTQSFKSGFPMDTRFDFSYMSGCFFVFVWAQLNEGQCYESRNLVSR